MADVDVPPYFLCPISLEIMKDPVTVSSGITYDRQSIEKWLYSNNNDCCPVTKQLLAGSDLTPNHTLRRLMQAWCTVNAANGVERIPTPKPPTTKAQIIKILNDGKLPLYQLKCLKKLRSIAAESETNKRCMESAGAVEFLASIVTSSVSDLPSEDSSDVFDRTRACDEALSILHNLQIFEAGLKALAGKNGEFIETLVKVMHQGSYESRAYATMLLKSLLELADPINLSNLRVEFFAEIIQVLKDHISHQCSISALQMLINLLPWGRNRVKAVEAGGVQVLIELLLCSTDRRPCEMALTALDLLCGFAEGRAELLRHGAGMVVVSKKILRVSQVGNEKAVRILNSIAKYSATPAVLQEMLSLGVVAKLCLVLQVECGSKTKEKAREILRLHSRSWRNSPCIPSNLQSSYPPSSWD